MIYLGKWELSKCKNTTEADVTSCPTGHRNKTILVGKPTLLTSGGFWLCGTNAYKSLPLFPGLGMAELEKAVVSISTTFEIIQNTTADALKNLQIEVTSLMGMVVKGLGAQVIFSSILPVREKDGR